MHPAQGSRQKSAAGFWLLTQGQQEWERSCAVLCLVTVLSDSLWPHKLQSTRLLCPWDSPGKNTRGVVMPSSRGIFPIQGSNPGLLHCRWVLYRLSHQGNPGILERVAYPFSSGSSQPRNRTGVSCIAGGFFTSWATGKPLRRLWAESKMQTSCIQVQTPDVPLMSCTTLTCVLNLSILSFLTCKMGIIRPTS